MSEYVIIRPRVEVSAESIADFLRERFQHIGGADFGENPLVNADIRVVVERSNRDGQSG